MRPQKLAKEELLKHCALQFKTYGYAGTSMDMLAKACGLTKASFYYYYPNKEALLLEVLNSTHQYLIHSLFGNTVKSELSAIERFEQMHERAIHFFTQGVNGCLIGIISMEAAYGSPKILAKIRSIFQDWQCSIQSIFAKCIAQDQAEILAKQSIADYEGAILMYRVTHDEFYINQVKQRILGFLNS
ncbi:TetR/AcrR family transcriptional regulator [Acinetobacter calcoaceticus]